MTQNDRTEVREMIQGVLQGWHDATVEREKLIYLSLNNIDSHLEKLNGKVAAHERTILENLPHGIQHCTQSAAIKEIRDVMVEKKGEGKYKEITLGKFLGIAGLAVAMFMAWIGYKDLKKEMKATKSEVQVTNDVIMSGQTRGQYYNPFAKDTIK